MTKIVTLTGGFDGSDLSPEHPVLSRTLLIDRKSGKLSISLRRYAWRSLPENLQEKIRSGAKKISMRVEG